LCLSAGEGLRPVPFVTGQPDLVQGGTPPSAGIGAPQAEGHVGQHRRPRQEAGVLEDHRPALRHPDPAAHLAVQPGQDPEEGALAGPAPAEQGYELVPDDLELDTVEHRARTETSGHALGPDDHRVSHPDLANVYRLGIHARALLSNNRTNRSESRPRTA
jgi:hypothetical protein